ncbi:MAG: SMI1/KNR4 family protein [Anaerolineae bacterium]|nr:SMI1/KNR4 family protein [Anaerolineae bacterium]
MEWHEFLTGITPNLRFLPPVDMEALERAEARLNITLPIDLRSLLQESNGLYETSVEVWPLKVIWSIEEIESENLAIRSDPTRANIYMSFESLLFFAGAGVDGIMFAYPITATGHVVDQRIIVWYPIEDSRPVLAFSLKDYLKRWLTSELKI